MSALFILLRLEGRHVDLDRMESALPPRHPRGYSMADLAAASRSLGGRMEGVRFSCGREDMPLTRPAIAFVNGARGGHFAVLRPVGATGTMVQVIDPPGAPRITDYDRILSSKAWTGRVLVPRDPWIVRNAVPLATGAAGFVLLLAGLTLTLRATRERSGQ